LEKKLGNVDRCRTLFGKLLEFSPSNCNGWLEYAKLEMSLDETDRVRALFELAIDQSLLDMPEIVWKGYIDFEIEQV
jgi:crooked neck